MARALENLDAIPTYLEFFGMARPPFAKLSAFSDIYHSDQYSLLAAHLASATEQTDCLLVICGADGSGKTTLLNRHISDLDEDVSYASFDETCVNGTQFYCELLQQFGFHDITGKLRELSHIAREFLIHRGTAGDPVLIIIDNAHLVSPSVLEQLRWIAKTRVNDRRVLSIVLAGNADLPRIIKSPAMSRIRFERQVDFNIRVYTEEETEDYIRHRLRLSGGDAAANFSNDAHPVIYRFTGGTPNAINRLCNAVLTEACALETRVITGDLVRSVADSRQILPHVVPLQGKGRRKTDRDVRLVIPGQKAEERIIAREPPPEPGIQGTEHDPAIADVDVADLLRQISQLSAQLGLQSTRSEKLAAVAEENADEIRRLQESLADSRNALEDSEKASNKLAADLKKQQSAARRAATRADKATARIDKLKSDLKDARSRAAGVGRLEKSLKKSQDECVSLRNSISDSRKQAGAAKKAKADAAKAEAKIEKLQREKSELKDSVSSLTADLKQIKEHAAKTDVLEASLKESQDECESLRKSVDALKTLEKSVMDKDARIVDLEAELESYVKADTSTQPQVPDEETESRSARSTAAAATGKSAGAIATIEVFRDGKMEQVLEIGAAASRVMIGRADDCELHLDSKFVSRHHALIFCSEDGAYIEDLNSFNGTLVNWAKVIRRDLFADDTVMIGDFQLFPRAAS